MKPIVVAAGTQSDGYTGNFGVSGNGYFATWLSAIFSGVLVHLCVPPVNNLMSKLLGGMDDTRMMLLWVSTTSR